MPKDSLETKKKILKEVIKQLQGGASPQEVKEKFKQALDGVNPEDIAKIEQELVKEGIPREQLPSLCDVHMAVFAEQLEKNKLQVPPGHPISILMEEHKILLERLKRLEGLVGETEQACERCDMVNVGEALKELQDIAKDFRDSDKHFLREENVLFPLLEKHGITEPPAIMWMEHVKIREKEKQFFNFLEKWSTLYYKYTVETMDFQYFKKQIGEVATPLCEIVPSHFFKENNVLFPTAVKMVTEKEWEEARREFDDIGYCCFTPQQLIGKPYIEGGKVTPALEGILRFENGSLSEKEIGAILDSLPIDLTFIDKNDTVRYFNKAEKRIFLRTKAVIGRKVQLCHPQKSVHIVNRILESFKTGKKDVAEFWIQMNNRLVHIRYFTIREKNGKYLGTLEVTQDLTDIKKIEGQKKLLDWED